MAFFILAFTATTHAQQLPGRSPFATNSFMWNPAMTSPEPLEWEVGATHQQEWVGFESSPQTTTIYGQYPVPKQNFSFGGYLSLDEIEPLRNNVLGLTYAYKLGFGSRRSRRRRKRARTRKDAQLSIGLQLAMQQTFVDGANYITLHPDDPLQPVGEFSVIVPNVGAGLYFASRPSGPDNKSYFFVGAGTNQILPQDVTFREELPTGNLRRAFHANGTVGYRAQNNSLIIEPSLWINTAGNVVNVQANIHVEMERQFWGALAYALNQTANVQLGYILPSGIVDGDAIRIGLQGSFNVGGFGGARGLGYGFYLAYRAR